MITAITAVGATFHFSGPMDSIVLRPRTATEIVDTTFRICRAHYGALVTAMLVVNAPVLLLGIFPATAPLASLAQNILLTVGDAAVIAIVSEVYLGRRAEASVGLRALRGRIWSLVGASILRGIFILVGLILFILPGLFMIAATFAVPMAIVVEGRSVGASFTYSRRLVEENLWHVVRTLTLLGVIVFGLIMGLAAVVAMATELLRIGDGFTDLIGTAAMILLYPLFSVGETLLYYDLRIRTEGFDLEMMLQHLGQAPSGATETAAARPIA